MGGVIVHLCQCRVYICTEVCVCVRVLPLKVLLCYSAVPRSTLAYFHHSGLSDFQDSKGHSLPQVTTPQHSTLPTVSDTLQHGPYQIAIQLLAFKL